MVTVVTCSKIVHDTLVWVYYCPLHFYQGVTYLSFGDFKLDNLTSASFGIGLRCSTVAETEVEFFSEISQAFRLEVGSGRMYQSYNVMVNGQKAQRPSSVFEIDQQKLSMNVRRLMKETNMS